MSISALPPDLRNLRACLVCSLVKSFEQFQREGCDNCEGFLQLRADEEKVYVCTSSNFDGLISLVDPDDSWVAKWQGLRKKCKGIYAVSVAGELPRDLVQDLKHAGVRYVPGQRDMSRK